MYAFPLDSFLGRFPEFANEEVYPISKVQNCGDRAMLHITPSQMGMPMHGFYREYALFLMTAHLITLDAQDDTDDPGSSLAGTPFKATVGSVSIEATKPNSFNSDDWNYWLNQTKYGRELLAYLDTQCAPGIFINTPCDSVRDLI
jgi:hypothetical protein